MWIYLGGGKYTAYRGYSFAKKDLRPLSARSNRSCYPQQRARLSVAIEIDLAGQVPPPTPRLAAVCGIYCNGFGDALVTF